MDYEQYLLISEDRRERKLLLHATRTSGSEVHSPKRCTRLIFQLRGCSFHFLFPLWIHFLFFSLPGTSGTVHRRERRSFYCLQLYKLSQRQLVLRNSRYWLSLAFLGQISILNHIISSLSKAPVLQETYISSATMEVVLKIPDGSTQLLQIVTERENIRNRPHSTDDLYFLLTHWWGKTKGAGNCQSTSL